jgi:CheY-like chemotaxis protein
MPNTGPIIIVDDDDDDNELLSDIVKELLPENEVKCFSGPTQALSFLLETEDKPFLIFCDINMPLMNGLELREFISNNEKLKRLCIPFIFLTTAATTKSVDLAYLLSVQGFFQKPTDYTEMQSLEKHIIDYWTFCRHPNNIRKFTA